MRLLFVAGWFLCLAALTGFLVEAIHRDHLVGILIVATGLVTLAVVPLLRARLDERPRS